ncbi:MAG: TSUP family transporter [Gammaproteobacteria bacterium]
MDAVVMCLTAFVAGGLTLFSGFGLGTLLMPVMALFFPVETAIAVTAVVHLIHNLAKLAIVGRFAEKTIVWRFGIPAFFAAMGGAWVLGQLSNLTPVMQYSLLGHQFAVLPVKVVIAVLLVGIVLLEGGAPEGTLRIEARYLPLGGILSGFFGGLSGHQGAFRSACLVNAGLTKEQFLGTSVVIACLVDLPRLTVYGASLSLKTAAEQPFLLLAIIGSALVGTVLAARFIKTVTMRAIRTLISVMLIGIALGLGAGMI